MRKRRIFMGEEELLSLRDHFSPKFVTESYFQSVLSELPEKPVWHRPDFTVPEGKTLTICNYCRRLYNITSTDDAAFLRDPKKREIVPVPYCERDAMSIMKKRLDSE